jgi:DNA-binding PadR family transcriptional regulator
MQPLSPTERVILGMLRLGPRCGYEIKSLVDVSTRFFWAASYGQIYPELKRLEEQGLIKGYDDPTGGRRRRVFELTDTGRERLHDWLTDDSDLVTELRHEGLLKLFFADSLSPTERVELARSIRRDHEQVADELRAIEPGAKAGAEEDGVEFPLHVLEFGIEYNEFMAGWAARLERELEGDRTPAAAPGR